MNLPLGGELIFFAHASHPDALHQAMHAGGFIAKRIDVGVVAAKAEGIEMLLGGRGNGQVLPPHVLVNVDNIRDLSQAEQFCPMAPIITARDEAQALELANQTEFGLSSAVFTKDEGRGLRFAQQIEAGMTHINDISVNDDPNNMLGGERTEVSIDSTVTGSSLN